MAWSPKNTGLLKKKGALLGPGPGLNKNETRFLGMSKMGSLGLEHPKYCKDNQSILENPYLDVLLGLLGSKVRISGV